MITSSIFKLHKTTKLFFVVIFVFLMVGGVSGATYYSRANGNWTTRSTWSLTSGGGQVGNGIYPLAGDNVIIEGGDLVTVNGSYSCTSLQIGSPNLSGNFGTLTFSGTTPSLTVSGNVQLGGFGNTARTGTITFIAGSTLDAGSVILGNTGVTPAAGIITMTAGGTLKAGSLSVNTVSGNTWTPGIGTVILDATNSLPITIFTTFNNLSTITTGTTTFVGNVSVTGNLNVGSATSLDLSTFTANRSAAGGSLTVAGTLMLGGTSGGQTGSNFPTNFSTITLTGGTINYDNATGGQTIFATPVYGTLTLDNTSGTQTAGGNLSVTTLNNNTNAAQVLNMVTNTLTVTTPNNTGTIRTQNTSGLPITSGKTWGGTVIFDASTAQTIPTSTFNNLTINNAGGALLGNNLAVNGTLTLSNGRLTLGAYNLTLGGSAVAVAGTLNASNMIVAEGVGELRKTFTGNGSYTFPVGDATGTAEYSPVTINIISGTYSSAYVAVKVANAKHPNNGSVSNYLNRYWTISSSGLTGFIANVTGTYVVGDVVGSRDNMVFGSYNGSLPWTKHVTLNSTSFNSIANKVSSFGAFTGINVLNPTVSISANPGFSVGQNAPLTLTANPVGDTPFSYVWSPGGATSASISPSTATNGSTSYSVTVTDANGFTGTTSSDVTVSQISVSVTTLSAFSYAYGAGPSVAQSFNVSAASLGNNLVITAPANFEISQSLSSSFSSSVTLIHSGGTVNSTTIYVRLKAGLSIGYAMQAITLTSTGSTPVNVNCKGTVLPSIAAAGGGSYCTGASIPLTSTSTGVTNQYWTGPNNFYALADSTIIAATIAMSGTYTVTGSASSGNDLIVNGSFTDNTGFSSSYGYAADIVGNTELNPEGLYSITTLASNVHSNFNSIGDHTSGSGNQMVINGSTSPGFNVWSQSVDVAANVDYQFSYWVQTVVNGVDGNPAQLQLFVNGVAAGPVKTAIPQSGQWTEFIYNWNSGSYTSANLSLVNQNTAGGGNDFALDDIKFQQVYYNSSSVAITVAASYAVGVSVVASSNPSTSGVAVTYTATPTNGGFTPVYEWKVNGIVVGTNSSTFSYVPVNGDVVLCKLTSSLTCNSGTSISSVIMTVNAAINFWVGSKSTNWANPSNWSALTVPTSVQDVVFATAANYLPDSAAVRDLYLDQDRTISNLINLSTKRLVIPPALALTVTNNITTSGVDSLIYIQSDSIQANGTLIFHNLVSSPVYATVEMYSKASWDLTQAVNSKYNWQYFGIPLRSIATVSPTFNFAYVRSWVESGTTIFNHWVALTDELPLNSFVGYEICQAAHKTYKLKGILENGNYSSGQLAYTILPLALFPGQHIFANPYTAAIDITQLAFGSATEHTVYMYNTGTYGIWNSTGGGTLQGYLENPGQYYAIPQMLAGQAGLQGQVPSMQAMLIKAMSNSSNATFGITYNSVVTKNTYLQRAPAINGVASSDKVSTVIDVKGEHFADRMWLVTNPACTRGFDNGWDGQKMPGSALTPQLFAMEADGNYQVNALPDMNDTELGFQAGQDTEYTLTFTHENIESLYAGVFLVDLTENKTIDITATGTTYTFVAETTPKPVNRFKIVTRPYEKEAADGESQVKIFSSLSTIFVQNLSTQAGECVVYDIAGRYLKKVPFGANGVTAISNNLKPGAYIARANAGSEEVSKRLIVR